MPLDDLGAAEVRRRPGCKTHHEYGPDGEVGGHEGVRARRVGPALYVSEIIGPEARGTDDGMDVVAQIEGNVVLDRRRSGEVDRDLRLRLHEIVERVAASDGCDEDDIGVCLDRPAGLGPHAPAGAHHTNPHQAAYLS